MKDNIIKLSGDAKCYVLDEIDYKSKKYVYCIEIDDKGEFIEDAVFIREVALNNNDLVVKPVEDFEISSIVNNLFIARAINE